MKSGKRVEREMRKKMTRERERLEAVAWAAHKAGMAYGDFSATVKEGDIPEIVKQWREDRDERIRRSYKNATWAR